MLRAPAVLCIVFVLLIYAHGTRSGWASVRGVGEVIVRGRTGAGIRLAPGHACISTTCVVRACLPMLIVGLREERTERNGQLIVATTYMRRDPLTISRVSDEDALRACPGPAFNLLSTR